MHNHLAVISVLNTQASAQGSRVALPLHRWQPIASAFRAGAVAPRLRDRQSLTASVQAASSTSGHTGFRVELLCQEQALCTLDAAQQLGWTQPQSVIVREVLLRDDQQPWVFAHSILPITTLTGHHHYLGRMGSQPLGAALFSDPTIHRGQMQVIKLRPQDQLFAAATAALTKVPHYIWGRRSTFWVGNAPLLVTEFFLQTW